MDLGRPKQRALLALLLLHANRPVPVDRVLDLLWGPDVPDRAVGDLQVHVSRLRRALEPDRPTRAPSQVLLSVAGGYLLRVGRDELDADRFEELADRGHRQLVAAEPRQARAALERALALWRGPALAEFAYEPFAQPEAARLEARRTLAHEDLFEAELALGHHAEAVAGLEALLVDNRLRERLWYLLMLALYRSDRQAEALRAFARARAVLGDELGIEPGNALRRLEADILAHAPELDWHPPPGRRAGRPDPALAPPGAAAAGGACPDPSAPSAPSAGPAAAATVPRPWSVAPTSWPSSTTPSPRRAPVGAGWCCVSGEAGIGKTRLVSEVASAAAQRGGWTAWGRGTEVEGAPPFWFWSQIIRSFLADGRPDELRRALGPGAADIAKIVPEVAALAGTPALPWPAEPGADRFRLYEGGGGLSRPAGGPPPAGPGPRRPPVGRRAVPRAHRAPGPAAARPSHPHGGHLPRLGGPGGRAGRLHPGRPGPVAGPPPAAARRAVRARGGRLRHPGHRAGGVGRGGRRRPRPHRGQPLLRRRAGPGPGRGRAGGIPGRRSPRDPRGRAPPAGPCRPPPARCWRWRRSSAGSSTCRWWRRRPTSPSTTPSG